MLLLTTHACLAVLLLCLIVSCCAARDKKFISSRPPEEIEELQRRFQQLVSNLPVGAVPPAPPVNPSKACLAMHRGCRKEYVEFLDQTVGPIGVDRRNTINDDDASRITPRPSSPPRMPLEQRDCEHWRSVEIPSLTRKKIALEGQIAARRVSAPTNEHCIAVAGNISMAQRILGAQRMALTLSFNSRFPKLLLLLTVVIAVASLIAWVVCADDPHPEIDQIVSQHRKHDYTSNEARCEANFRIYAFFKVVQSDGLKRSIRRLQIVGAISFALSFAVTLHHLVRSQLSSEAFALEQHRHQEMSWFSRFLDVLQERGLIGVLIDLVVPLWAVPWLVLGAAAVFCGGAAVYWARCCWGAFKFHHIHSKAHDLADLHIGEVKRLMELDEQQGDEDEEEKRGIVGEDREDERLDE